MKTYCNFSKEEVLKEQVSSINGLSSQEAAHRLAEHGKNALVESKRRTPLAMFIDQFKDFMIIVLIVAAIVSGIIGEVTDTIAIVVIIVLNAVIGFVQEYRAEKAMAALKKMASPYTTVIRDGMQQVIESTSVVLGDIVVLVAGNLVPADIRLCETSQLKIEEAALTGESVPAEKHSDILNDGTFPLGDRKNMTYRGTVVTYGRGKGVVVGTGMRTELGKIAQMLQNEDEVKTPLQKRLARFGKHLALIILFICAIVFGVGVMRGELPLLMLLTAVSLAVAAIPEALPAVVTISLALGAKKMVAQNALIRKLPAVETLGSVTYICTDKTGTLTMNKMTVESVHTSCEINKDSVENNELLKTLFLALSVSNDAHKDNKGIVLGDPTETALYAYAGKNGYDKTKLVELYPRVAELPFDSERKCMTTFHEVKDPDCRINARYISFTKGAPEVIAANATVKEQCIGSQSLQKDELLKINEKMADQGLRVLCVAMRVWDNLPKNNVPENVETDLTVLGLVGMIDPPREEVREAVALCKTAGIKPVMITGDHPITARTIARKLDIISSEDGEIITGKELGELSLEELEERVERVRVYARVAPEQKLKIVKALQDKGQYVAMTGDGVNDAPALKRADIGVAMGITGTDVSKEAADMVLLDDNFETVVHAVEAGRRIFDNIRKFIKYIMTSNAGEIWTIFLAPFLGLPIPLIPIQILWINLVTDGLPGLALTAEPAEKGIMNRPPRHPKESIFANGLGLHIFWVGLLMGGVSLFSQAWAIETGRSNWQTIVFTVLCLSQMGHVLAVRSENESLLSQGIMSNVPLLGAFLLTFLLQMATIYVPFLNPIFKTAPLTAGELTFTLFLSSIVFIAVEIEKLLRRRKIIKY